MPHARTSPDWVRSAIVYQVNTRNFSEEGNFDGVTARLGLAYMGVKQAFTTRNTQVDAASVHLQLIDGPFSTLEGLWLFKPLGAEGGGPAACKVEFDLRYAFAGPALDALISPVFDKVANTFVDSFVRRAEAVYGAR